MSERPWQLAAEAENDPRLQYLDDLVDRTLTAHDEVADAYNPLYEIDEDGLAERVNKYLATDFYQSLSHEQQKRVTGVLSLGEAAVWRYGSVPDPDSLWETDKPVMTRPVEPIDKLVLSGIVGHDLSGLNRRLDRFSAAQPDALKAAVLLGELAMPHIIPTILLQS